MFAAAVSRSFLVRRVCTQRLLSSVPLATDSIVHVTLVDEDGKRHKIAGLVGQRLTHAAMLNGLAELLQDDGMGGSDIPYQVVHNERYTQDTFGEGCASSNPHVIIPNEWYDKLPKPMPDEIQVLESMDIFDRGPRTPHSRIATEIVLSKELDGLEVFVPDAYPTEIP